MKRLFAGVAASVFLLGSLASWAYNFNSNSPKWPGAAVPFYIGISGTSSSGVRWADALADAAQEWNDKTAFTFHTIDEYRDPCAGTGVDNQPDYLNAADFHDSACGTRLSNSTIAVTMFFTEPNKLGSADIVEADIIFNSNLAFDVYDGPLRSNAYDLRRVALHELGHVLGLNHEDRNKAIMNANIGDLFELQPDDINGANTLYSGLSNCQNTAIGFGWTFGALEPGDCRVQQLMAGGSDASLVDVLMLDLPQPTEVTLDLQTDGKLAGVLFLATDKLRFIASDENSAGECHPHIQTNLPAGRYAVLVNTYDSTNSAPRCASAITGSWRLSLSYNSSGLLELPGKNSFQGGISEAKFFGGVTTNGGQSYSNRVRPNQPFDVLGRIEIDPRHQGQRGFLVVAVVLNGEILVKNRRGDFVAYQPEQELVPVAEERVLGTVENIDIVRQFRADSIGINNASVDFLIGYGVNSNPDELYFHQQPINLLVE